MQFGGRPDSRVFVLVSLDLRAHESRHTGIVGIWMFPHLLAAGANAAGALFEPAKSLRASVTEWPVPQDVYHWLPVMVVLSVVWLVSGFIAVTNRETVVLSLQWDAAIRTMMAAVFSGFGGFVIATDQLQYWFVVPGAGAVIDSLATGWLGINNAAQKPYPSQRGTM